MIRNLNVVINNLKLIKKSKNLIDMTFIDIALDRIKDRANNLLDQRTEHFWGSDARSWTKNVTAHRGILENNDMNSASIEFGIGTIGAMGSLEEVGQLMQEYKYNVPSEYKDDFGRWSFTDERTGIYLSNFSGYIGKSFLYDTFTEYMQDRLWVEDYKIAFDRVMRGICKK